jgi:hypothetical protein
VYQTVTEPEALVQVTVWNPEVKSVIHVAVTLAVPLAATDVGVTVPLETVIEVAKPLDVKEKETIFSVYRYIPSKSYMSLLVLEILVATGRSSHTLTQLPPDLT